VSWRKTSLPKLCGYFSYLSFVLCISPASSVILSSADWGGYLNLSAWFMANVNFV
jgi:hypothetical protein